MPKESTSLHHVRVLYNILSPTRLCRSRALVGLFNKFWVSDIILKVKILSCSTSHLGSNIIIDIQRSFLSSQFIALFRLKQEG